jgi:sugar phosphate isomerase/epimerase
MKLACFTKSFQDWPLERVCAQFQAIGLDGLDLTVRPGGHVEPGDAETGLPLAVKAAQESGIEVIQLTTAVTQADDEATRLIQLAGQHGIDRIKLGYYKYRQFGALREEMDQVRGQLQRLASLGEKHGVRPCVHIHSGACIPSHGTMLYELLRDQDPRHIGAYVDPLHMTKEGGGDGWRQGLDLLAPWIALCSVKNFTWHKTHRDATGQQRWETRVVPIDEGIAPLPDFVAALKKLGYQGPYSMHGEYKGRHSFKDLDTEGCLQQTARDLAYFKKLL